MILGVGLDLVEIARIENSLSRFGRVFAERVLLPPEMEYCFRFAHPAPHVAARFAAKEAVSKAFGTGIGESLGWHDIEVARRPTGEPFILLHPPGNLLLQQRGATGIHLSLTHSQSHAAAVAILEGPDRPPPRQMDPSTLA